MVWNERMRQLRDGSGVSLKEMASQIGVSEATAQRYESGHIKQVPYEAIVAYSKKFGCSPSYIMGWTDSNGTSTSSTHATVSLLNEITKDKELSLALNKYFQLTAEQKKHVIDTIHFLHQTNKEDN